MSRQFFCEMENFPFEKTKDPFRFKRRTFAVPGVFVNSWSIVKTEPKFTMSKFDLCPKLLTVNKSCTKAIKLLFYLQSMTIVPTIWKTRDGIIALGFFSSFFFRQHLCLLTATFDQDFCNHLRIIDVLVSKQKRFWIY